MNKFKKIYIEITNVCNLHCNFCPETKRKGEFMSLHTFENILKSIKGYSEFIYFHVKGEPLLHPLLPEFLDLACSYNYKVNITTNGTLIKKVQDKIINKPALRQINFSLHSFDGNECGITIDNYIGNIISFISESLKESNIINSLRLWNLENETNAEYKTCKNNSLKTYKIKSTSSILKTLEDAFNLDIKISEELKGEGGIKLLPRLYLNQALRFDWPDIHIEDLSSAGFCYGLRDQLAILVDGTVVPCCLDGEGIINLGNIKNSSISEILNSTRARNLLEGFSRREAVENLCKKCGYRHKFTK